MAVERKHGFTTFIMAIHNSGEIKDLEARHRELRGHLDDLRHLREARQNAIGRQARLKGPAPKSAPSVEESELLAVQEIQKTSKQIHTAILRIANCACHSFYFQLRTDPSGKSTTPEFKLILTNGSHHTGVAVRKESAPAPPCAQVPAAESTTEQPRRIRFADDEPSLTYLNDLCRSITTQIAVPAYLGELRCTDPHRHVYSEYHKPSTLRTSLPSVFRYPQPRIRPLLSQEQKYRLAWIISASFLRFGFFNAAWFRDNWRTDDLYFLAEKITSKELEFPHLSIVFNSGKDKKKGTSLAKNELLYSLAIALIEIAYGDTLRNLVLDGKGGDWDYITEYMGAKALVEKGGVAKELGRKYGQIVKRCFWGDLQEGQELREFYRHVECELKTCLKKFTEDD
ncbi:hypothetical protein FPQ18DRAFT_402507 [Pyronema domesticum]|nr:hypothetical protein FPQ18DRAFT_402507 [Pyronema domesticum]